MKNQNVQTTATRTVDCFRKIADTETGEVTVKRWVEERQVSATLTVGDDGGVFHKGARIA